jgi:hypothetical protein
VDSVGSDKGPVAGSSKRGDETSGSGAMESVKAPVIELEYTINVYFTVFMHSNHVER